MAVLNTMDLKFYSALGIPTFYIPNPIQFLPFTPKTIEPNDVKNLVWIARLDQFQKNYVEALKIFKLVCEKIDDVVCHIVGRGEAADVEYITNYVKTNGLENKIMKVLQLICKNFFLPRMSNSLLRASNVFL